MATPPTNKFTHLTGVPVHYARPPRAPYGTRGRLPKYWLSTPAFQAKIERAFEELWSVHPMGKATLIVSAGFWVDKPGLHGLGRAMDLDSIWWDGAPGDLWVANDYPSDKAHYLAIEAVFKKHFGVVLDWHYNASHHDHLHINDTDEPGFSPGARSEVLFVQAALAEVFNLQVHITGTYTEETRRAAESVLRRLNVPPDLTKKPSWMAFLSATAKTGFGAVHKTETPLDLAHALYIIVGAELEGDERRKRIEAAINVFLNHEDTQTFLSKYRGT